MSHDVPILPGLRAGDVLAGKYRIDAVLGQGGMGIVVAAYHLHLEERVAIKFMLSQALENAEAVTRFAREARAAAKIKSEHVARVTDVGTLEDGAPYMVMEYLDGSDLSEWLRSSGRLPIEQAVGFVLQACEAVAEAHACGIVHRDLKPSNLFVIRRVDGELSVKVLDFGVSKMTGPRAPGADMTSTAAMMGSPLYMSPEQMQSSKDADARSDIWALGVILYELITAALPFMAQSVPELVLKIAQGQPAPIAQHLHGVPAGLEGVILRCLEKSRDQRFQTVADLATALVPFASDRAKVSVERISGVLRGAGFAVMPLSEPTKREDGVRARLSGTPASWGRTNASSRPPRKRLAAIVAMGGLTAALFGTSWVAIRGRDFSSNANTAGGQGSGNTTSGQGSGNTTSNSQSGKAGSAAEKPLKALFRSPPAASGVVAPRPSAVRRLPSAATAGASVTKPPVTSRRAPTSRPAREPNRIMVEVEEASSASPARSAPVPAQTARNPFADRK